MTQEKFEDCALFHAIAFEWGMNHKHGPMILGTKHKDITVNS